jgi:hypothetical protein
MAAQEQLTLSHPKMIQNISNNLRAMDSIICFNKHLLHQATPLVSRENVSQPGQQTSHTPTHFSNLCSAYQPHPQYPPPSRGEGRGQLEHDLEEGGPADPASYLYIYIYIYIYIYECLLVCFGRVHSVSDLRYDMQVGGTRASSESSHSQLAARQDRVCVTLKPLILAIA